MPDNLFEAPKTPVGKAAEVVPPYRPTPLHLKLLKIYRRYHVEAPRFGSLLRLSLPRLTSSLIVFGGGVLFFRYIDWIQMSWFQMGLGAGYLLTVLSSNDVFIKIWPMLQEIVDWNKVDAILGEVGEPPQPPG